MAFAQGACFPEDLNDFVLSGDDFHKQNRQAPIITPEGYLPVSFDGYLALERRNLLLALALHLDCVAAHGRGERDRVAADLARVLRGHGLAIAARTLDAELEAIAIDLAILDRDIRALAARSRAGQSLAIDLK